MNQETIDYLTVYRETEKIILKKIEKEFIEGSANSTSDEDLNIEEDESNSEAEYWIFDKVVEMKTSYDEESSCYEGHWEGEVEKLALTLEVSSLASIWSRRWRMISQNFIILMTNIVLRSI